MSAIKDVYDLVEKLHQSTKDKQILKLLLPIKEKILEVEKENLRLQGKILTIQREHNDTMSKLKFHNSELESEISNLKNKKLFQGGIIKERFPR